MLQERGYEIRPFASASSFVAKPARGKYTRIDSFSRRNSDRTTTLSHSPHTDTSLTKKYLAKDTFNLFKFTGNCFTYKAFYGKLKVVLQTMPSYIFTTLIMSISHEGTEG